jgi:hypothetical protein
VREIAGHLLSFKTVGEVKVKVAGIWRVMLELPKDNEEFDQTKVEMDRGAIRWED